MINAKVTLLEKAIALATHMHHGQVRKNNQEPYINHPLRVMTNIRHNGYYKKTTLVAAILHDVVEDTSYTIEDVKHEFGDDVAEIVNLLTKPDDWDGTYMDYIRVIAESGNINAMIVKFYDAHDNSIWIEDGKEPVLNTRYQKVKELLGKEISLLGHGYMVEKYI